MLSEQAISEYMEVYKKSFGEEISKDEADRQGTRLLRLFRLVYKPVPRNWKKELDKKYARSK